MERNADAWVVIPAYNEGSIATRVITSTQKFLPDITYVGNASSGDTVCAAKRAGALMIPHPVNLGQETAL